MVTEVIMQRELLGDFVRQKSKSGFFNANDLMRVGNKWRANNSKTILWQDNTAKPSHAIFMR